MSQEKTAVAPDTAPEAAKPAETGETGQTGAAKKHGRAGGPGWSRWIGAALLLGLVAMLTIWSGVLGHFTSPVNGIVRIESPQIYTRERLVNDRFREQAWLERQLRQLEAPAVFISSVRTDRTQISAGTGDATQDREADGSNGEESEKTGTELRKDLVDADDRFNLQRDMRSTIRRALIENELDDRHDLGANSIYQLNFGAAIIAGSRTRNIAAIDMVLEPVEELTPLDDAVAADDPICGGLHQFECAFLLDSGYVHSEADEHGELLTEYRLWKALFSDWLRAENSSYAREADDIERLLRQGDSKGNTWKLLVPYFRDLDRKAAIYTSNLEKIAQRKPEDIENKCKFLPDLRDLVDPKGTVIRLQPIYFQIRDFVSRCAEYTRAFIQDEESIEPVSQYVIENILGGNADLLAALKNVASSRAKTSTGLDEATSQALLLWDQALKFNLRSFNGQCSFNESIVEQNSQNSISIAIEAEDELVKCIVNSIIKDYGSHPFSRIERVGIEGQLQSPDTSTWRSRPDFSDYTANKGIQSVVASDAFQGSRARERTNYLYVTNTYDVQEDPYPEPAEKLLQRCGTLYSDIAVSASDIEGINAFSKFPSAPEVGTGRTARADIIFGWKFLETLICHAISKTLSKTPNDEGSETNISRELIREPYSIPTGLFRFIRTLSAGQKSFSYSVQPSGAFRLQQRAEDTTIDWRAWLPGNGSSNTTSARLASEESWIEKQYQIIGYGAQSDVALSSEREERRANFGWFFFPAASHGFDLGPAVMKSANVKLSAIISAPAWWRTIVIRSCTEWREPHTLALTGEPGHGECKSGPDAGGEVRASGEGVETQRFTVDLPLNLEFIRNHFAYVDTKRPSLYRLQVPSITARACNTASIVLKGERLWRSTVVTLGGQKADLIQVMPDMRGIIAHFDRIDPDLITVFESNAHLDNFGAGGERGGIPITIWTSEGQTAVYDAITVQIPEPIWQNLLSDRPACSEPQPPGSSAESRQTLTNRG